jgi:hypothetical protein
LDFASDIWKCAFDLNVSFADSEHLAQEDYEFALERTGCYNQVKYSEGRIAQEQYICIWHSLRRGT